MVALDSGREVSFESEKFRHIDRGYAVTSYSSQGQTVDRVLVNADVQESDLLRPGGFHLKEQVGGRNERQRVLSKIRLYFATPYGKPISSNRRRSKP